MGRMLEALKQGCTRRARPAEAASLLRPYHPESHPEPVPQPEPAAGVSYIEVGGGRNCIEASADVLACPVAIPIPAGSDVRQESPSTLPAEAETIRLVPGPAAEPVPQLWQVTFQALPTQRTGRPGRFAAELIAYHQPTHEVSKQYAALMEVVAAPLALSRTKVLLFTAPQPQGGTTTVLLNLAISVARQEGRRVAVVDANLRRPAIAGRLGLAEAPGLREVLARAVPLSHALRETQQTNLQALTAGGTSPDLWLPLDGLRGSLRQLRDSFDLVFVDAPAWHEGPEAAALSALCDGIYLVIHQPTGQQTRPVDPQILLSPCPANLQGCILASA